MPTVREHINAVKTGEARCEAITADALAAARRSDSVFTFIDPDAQSQAVRIDRARDAGEQLPPLAGLPVTLKDLFDVRGQPTLAGSKILRDESPATADAEVVSPCIPPPIAAVENNPRIADINLRILRNASTVNYFDGCAVSLPCHLTGCAPVGLMLAAGGGDDDALYQIAAGVESVLNQARVAVTPAVF